VDHQRPAAKPPLQSTVATSEAACQQFYHGLTAAANLHRNRVDFFITQATVDEEAAVSEAHAQKGLDPSYIADVAGDSKAGVHPTRLLRETKAESNVDKLHERLIDTTIARDEESSAEGAVRLRSIQGQSSGGSPRQQVYREGERCRW